MRSIGMEREDRQWGSMRAALHDGQTQGRVTLAHVVAKPHAYGVGALEGLAGEVAIFDGQCWIAQPDDQGSVSVAHGPGEYVATLLTIAYVPTWNTVDVSRNVESDNLDGFVRDSGR
jgi:acetolactate decarboxylase